MRIFPLHSLPVALGFLAMLCNGIAGERSPLPDDKTIDTFQYTYTPKLIGSSASLSITKAGKVRYYYSSEHHTGSGGRIVKKTWEIPGADATALFQSLMKAGVLKMDNQSGGKFPHHHVAMSYGRWVLTLRPEAMPQKVMRQLLPFLLKAHPKEWKPLLEKK